MMTKLGCKRSYRRNDQIQDCTQLLVYGFVADKKTNLTRCTSHSLQTNYCRCGQEIAEIVILSDGSDEKE